MILIMKGSGWHYDMSYHLTKKWDKINLKIDTQLMECQVGRQRHLLIQELRHRPSNGGQLSAMLKCEIIRNYFWRYGAMCSIMSQHTSCVIGPPCLLGLGGCVPKGSPPPPKLWMYVAQVSYNQRLACVINLYPFLVDSNMEPFIIVLGVGKRLVQTTL